jgi:hypothetical protein
MTLNRCNGYGRRVENVRTTTDNEERNRTSRRNNVHGVFNDTRRPYNTVLHTDIFLIGTNTDL